jgi:hypothetical protein
LLSTPPTEVGGSSSERRPLLRSLPESVAVVARDSSSSEYRGMDSLLEPRFLLRAEALRSPRASPVSRWTEVLRAPLPDPRFPSGRSPPFPVTAALRFGPKPSASRGSSLPVRSRSSSPPTRGRSPSPSSSGPKPFAAAARSRSPSLVRRGAEAPRRATWTRASAEPKPVVLSHPFEPLFASPFIPGPKPWCVERCSEPAVDRSRPPAHPCRWLPDCSQPVTLASGQLADLLPSLVAGEPSTRRRWPAR